MASRQHLRSLPPPEGPEYMPCTCGHIEPEHKENAGACLGCTCAAYRAVPGAPARPHLGDSTEVLKTALVNVSADARRYSQTGPKSHEDALHQVADGLLDELQARGEL